MSSRVTSSLINAFPDWFSQFLFKFIKAFLRFFDFSVADLSYFSIIAFAFSLFSFEF